MHSKDESDTSTKNIWLTMSSTLVHEILILDYIIVSHTACKDEFRRNLRSHSWSVFSFFIMHYENILTASAVSILYRHCHWDCFTSACILIICLVIR